MRVHVSDSWSGAWVPFDGWPTGAWGASGRVSVDGTHTDEIRGILGSIPPTIPPEKCPLPTSLRR